ncbi:MAG: dolichyl-phosphate beta-glucosyltransferase [Terriglobia bacterium]
MSDPLLSVVIPAYNESGRIGRSLESVRRYLASKPFASEVIVVDDGSTDKMPELLEGLAAAWPKLRILRNGSNRGKGFSVRRGVLDSRGTFVLFTDADLSAPIEEAGLLFSALESTGADAAIGSRALNRKLTGVRQPLARDLSGRVFNLLVRAFTGLDLHDTQCGFKLFRLRTTRRAFELERVSGFGFDPELLFLIHRLGGKITEVPVRWNNDPNTKVHFLRDAARMFCELAAIRWRAITGGYPPAAR